MNELLEMARTGYLTLSEICTAIEQGKINEEQGEVLACILLNC